MCIGLVPRVFIPHRVWNADCGNQRGNQQTPLEHGRTPKRVPFIEWNRLARGPIFIEALPIRAFDAVVGVGRKGEVGATRCPMTLSVVAPVGLVAVTRETRDGRIGVKSTSSYNRNVDMLVRVGLLRGRLTPENAGC